MTDRHKPDAARGPDFEPLHGYDVIRAALADAQPAET